jgi:hypothetical protein
MSLFDFLTIVVDDDVKKLVSRVGTCCKSMASCNGVLIFVQWYVCDFKVKAHVLTFCTFNEDGIYV